MKDITAPKIELRTKEDSKVKVEITSSDPQIVAVVAALTDALVGALDGADLKDKEEMRAMVTAVALTRFVWERGQENPQIPTTVTRFLMNMAVDHGLGEELGMVAMRDGETLQ